MGGSSGAAAAEARHRAAAAMPLRSPAGPPPVVVGGCIESPAGDERLLVAARPFNSNEQLDDAQSILHALGSKSRHGEENKTTKRGKRRLRSLLTHREAPRLSEEEELDDELDESESEPDELEEDPDEELDEEEPELEPPSLPEELEEEEPEPSEPSSSSPDDDASQKRDFCASA